MFLSVRKNPCLPGGLLLTQIRLYLDFVQSQRSRLDSFSNPLPSSLISNLVEICVPPFSVKLCGAQDHFLTNVGNRNTCQPRCCLSTNSGEKCWYGCRNLVLSCSNEAFVDWTERINMGEWNRTKSASANPNSTITPPLTTSRVFFTNTLLYTVRSRQASARRWT